MSENYNAVGVQENIFLAGRWSQPCVEREKMPIEDRYGYLKGKGIEESAD